MAIKMGTFFTSLWVNLIESMHTLFEVQESAKREIGTAALGLGFFRGVKAQGGHWGTARKKDIQQEGECQTMGEEESGTTEESRLLGKNLHEQRLDKVLFRAE